ncbi:Asp-tRNA(Asn)/Glu-tRNA(Gln) amidotransferase subunit GatA [Patescibacteria group bacterium]
MNLPLSIKETQKGLIQKKYSTVELVDEYLKNVEKNKDLNAFITVSDDLAYKKAKQTDSLLKDSNDSLFKSYPLLGCVVAHKDLFLTKGVRTTAGSKVLNSYVPDYSAIAVERLEKAGAIMIGKTNCDAWAHGASGENSDFGPTKNPSNKNYVPGGSSSGSAAAVSAKLCLFSTGTDTGGSIRQPASFCGVYGIKPTYGAVSRYGVIAMASSLDCVGAMANKTDDLQVIINIMKDEDNYDSTVTNKTSKAKTKKPILGVPNEYFSEGIDKEVKDNAQKAIEVYKKLGYEVKNVSLPHTKYAISVYYIIQPAEVSSNLGRYDGVRYGKDRNTFSSEAKRRIMLGTYVLSAGYYDAFYLKAMKVRSKIITDFDNVFKHVDTLIAPVSPTPAFKLGEKLNNPLKMYLADILTAPANLAGIPGLAVPYNSTKDKLPLGFQLLGPRFSENTLFELAKEFEKHHD